jgi:uncharacterized protein (TIGR03435 family)
MAYGIDHGKLPNPSCQTCMPDLPPGVPRENVPPEILERPSIFDTLRQQLGLRLNPQKGPVEYYVIDRAEKASN